MNVMEAAPAANVIASRDQTIVFILFFTPDTATDRASSWA
jgi:hypothetical protein